jgi:hypothetical protein
MVTYTRKADVVESGEVEMSANEVDAMQVRRIPCLTRANHAL